MMSLKCILVMAIEALCELIDKLTETIEAVCGDDCGPTVCAATLAGAEGEGDASWTSGPSTGQPLTYPTPILETIADWVTVATASEADLTECCAAHTPESAVTLRFKMMHKLIGLPHTGFVLSTSAGNFTATSANNTSTLGGGYPSQAVGVGLAAGQQDADFVERWVDITATCADLMAGIKLSSFAFEGQGTGNYDEQLNGMSAEVIAIEGC